MKKLLLLVWLIMISATSIAQDVVLDFTTNEKWGLPEGSGAGLTEEHTFSDGTYSVTLAATTKYYFNKDGYLMLGKQGSTLTLPAFGFAVTKIEIVGREGASTGTKQNIFAIIKDEAVPVSTETTGAKETNTYAIDSKYQAAGTIYQLKVLSEHNTQITKINIFVLRTILVSSLSLNNSSLDLKVGESATLSAIIKPDYATNKTIEWSSSDSSVVSVSDGVVSALSVGTCIVKAKTTDGSNKTATCNVTVKKHSQTIDWNQDLSSIICGGELVELLATSSSGLPIVFSSSDENVASIFDMGNAVYLNPTNTGMAKITATQPGDNYYEAASVAKDVNVVEPSGIEDIMVDNDKYVIHTIGGICIGVFSKEEYNSFIKNKPTKGIYIVNGWKMKF